MHRNFNATAHKGNAIITAPFQSLQESIVNLQKSTAAMQCLNTTEILESVLHYLPPSDVIGARGINTFFRNVVDNSQKLKRATFRSDSDIPILDLVDRASPYPSLLEPDPDDMEIDMGPETLHRAWLFDRRDSSIRHSLKTTSDSLRCETGFISTHSDWFEQIWLYGAQEPWPALVYIVEPHPAIPIRTLDDSFSLPCQTCRIGREIPERFRDVRSLETSFLSKRLPDQNAIFWDTFITQPAVAAIVVHIRRTHGTPRSYNTSKWVYQPTGVTMRDIYKSFCEIGLELRYGQAVTGHENVEEITIEFHGAAAVPASDVQLVEKHTAGLKCIGTGVGTDSDDRFFFERCNDATENA